MVDLRFTFDDRHFRLKIGAFCFEDRRKSNQLIKNLSAYMTTLYEALVQAGSQVDTEARKAGEQRLKEMRQDPGFLTGLLEVFRSGADTQVRLLAAIQMKNSIDSLWRGTMLAEEKDFIRGQLLDAAETQSPQLEQHFSIVVAKIAKHDFPRAWPTIFEELSARIGAATSPDALRIPLLLLHQVLKVVQAAKIGPARSRLNELASPLIGQLGPVYTKLLQAGDLKVSYSCLKALGTLIYSGPDGLHRTTVVVDLCELLKEMLPQFEQTQKHVRRIGKIFERTADKKPVTFCMLFPEYSVLDMYRNLIIEGFSKDKKVVIQGASIFVSLLELVSRDVRNISAHMLPLKLRFRDPEDRADLETAYDQTKKYFESDNVLLSIIEVVLSRYFVLTEEDLELWKEDPEEYVQEDLLATREYSVPVCFQNLFFRLLKTFPFLGDQIMAFITRVFENPLDILRLDAALQALQYGSFVFSNTMTVSQIFEQLLILVNQNQNTENYNIIRRRMCLLVTEWLPINSDEGIRVLIYRVVTELLFTPHPLNDLPVQLAALQVLKCAVDDLDFETESFMPYADTTFMKIYSLLNKDVQSLEIKRSILEVLCTLVEQLGRQIHTSHIKTILEILPILWSERSDNQLIKSVIIQTLMHLVDSAKEKSSMTHPFATEVLTVSVDPKSPLFSYLVEDALGLWQSLITNADQPYEDLIKFFGPLLNLLTHSTENIGEQLTIMASYTHLQPALLANPQDSLRLLSLFAEYLPHAGVEAVILMLNVIELMSKYIPLEKWHASLIQSGLVPILTEYGREPGGDLVIEIRMTRVFIILSWMAIQDANVVVQTFNFSVLADGWVRAIKVIGDPHDKKLLTLGLTLSAKICQPVLVANSPLFIDIWTMVLDEVREQNGDAEIYHTSTLYPGETEDDLTPEQIRNRSIAQNDPIHRIDLKNEITAAAQPLGWVP